MFYVALASKPCTVLYLVSLHDVDADCKEAGVNTPDVVN